MYPRIVINMQSLCNNAGQALELCRQRGVRMQAVVKALAGQGEAIAALAALGIDEFGDASLDDMAKYQHIPGEKWLIRLPMLSEVQRLIQLSDGCLISEEAALLAIEQEAAQQGRCYAVLLMAEVGDLREGCMEEELLRLAALAESLPHIELRGIGANLSCYGEILPDERNMAELCRLAALAEDAIGRRLLTVSGGNSSSYPMLAAGELPRRIDHLRLGESWLLGNIPCHDRLIEGFCYDAFRVEAQIIELKVKPSCPWGEQGGKDSFGGHQEFVDAGPQRRALLALGKRDLYIQGLRPLGKGVSILGGSSDHLICSLDEGDYAVGDILAFGCDYAAMASAMSSAGLEKVLE